MQFLSGDIGGTNTRLAIVEIVKHFTAEENFASREELSLERPSKILVEPYPSRHTGVFRSCRACPAWSL